MDDWKLELKSEFLRAARARERGNEGQARVCARRAAGIAIREYLIGGGNRVPTASAYDLLNLLKEDPHLAPGLGSILDHLTVRVTEEFKLPIDVDLIAEARVLCTALLPDWKPEDE